MTQPHLPFDIPWLNDPERDYASQLHAGLIALCENRGHTPDALTTGRIRLIILTDAMANRLEARLAALLDQPSQRVPGAQANATTIARHRHARALDDFDAAYPQPAPAPPEPAKQDTRFGYTEEYRQRVIDVMEKMAPELETYEDPVVTTYFMEKDAGRKFHYELPKEAYTDIIRKPNFGGPIDPITREPMILMQYRARQAKWDEIRRLKAEAKAKEQAEADGKAVEETHEADDPTKKDTPNKDAQNQYAHSEDVSRSQVALGNALVLEAKLPPDPEDNHSDPAPRSQVALGNALVPEAALPPDPECQAQLGAQVCSQVQLGNKKDEEPTTTPNPNASPHATAQDPPDPPDLPPCRAEAAPAKADPIGVNRRESVAKNLPLSRHSLAKADPHLRQSAPPVAPKPREGGSADKSPTRNPIPAVIIPFNAKLHP